MRYPRLGISATTSSSSSTAVRILRISDISPVQKIHASMFGKLLYDTKKASSNGLDRNAKFFGDILDWLADVLLQRYDDPEVEVCQSLVAGFPVRYPVNDIVRHQPGIVSEGADCDLTKPCGPLDTASELVQLGQVPEYLDDVGVVPTASDHTAGELTFPQSVEDLQDGGRRRYSEDRHRDRAKVGHGYVRCHLLDTPGFLERLH